MIMYSYLDFVNIFLSLEFALAGIQRAAVGILMDLGIFLKRCFQGAFLNSLYTHNRHTHATLQILVTHFPCNLLCGGSSGDLVFKPKAHLGA